MTVRSLSPEYPPTTDIDAIARLVWDQCEDNAVLVGHSFGGYVALAMLAQRPAAVAGIALVNSHARADTEAAQAIRGAIGAGCGRREVQATGGRRDGAGLPP